MTRENNRRRANRKGLRSRLTRRIAALYLLSLFVFVSLVLLCLFFSWQVCASITWYPDDPLYRILSLLRDYLPLTLGVPLFLGWAILTYAFMGLPLRYLDEVIDASEQLVSSREQPIFLSTPLQGVQEELNRFREQALSSERAAQEAEQRKTELIVYLAHDLKTPLTSVIGYLTLLRDEPNLSLESRARFTGIALSKAERLEDLINEFFDITRFSLTTLTLERKTIHFSRMLEQIAFEFRPLLSERNLEMDLQIPPGETAFLDPDKMERVLDNLLRNAAHYATAGTKIRLSLRRLPAGLEIRVENQGKTIPKEKLDHIFERFFRLDDARSSDTGGAGLGLAIAKEIVEQHGGTIAAESREGSIAFTVFLPQRPESAPT
ncbi:MAG: sensor histidine kinase [Candidatus Spyradocola sp.]